jgi:hypothetical protein
LARTSAEQIALARAEQDRLAKYRYHVAYDTFWKIQNDLIRLMQSLADNTFGIKPNNPIYPENWPDASNALYERVPQTMSPAIKLGLSLRLIDSSITDYFRNATLSTSTDTVKQAAAEASEQCKALYEALPKE